MPRRHLRLLALLAVLITALLTSCGGPDAGKNGAPALPDGPRLLSDSAEAMRKVTSLRFNMQAETELPVAGVPIKSAAGQLTNEGSAKGTATADLGRQLTELAFVIIGDDLYLRGPTGGFTKLSATSASALTAILNPDRGIPAVLAGGGAAKTEAREQVGGVDAYRVKANFSGQSLSKVVPGFNQDSAGLVWIAVDDFRLLQAQFPTSEGDIIFGFSDFNAPADITAPK